MNQYPHLVEWMYELELMREERDRWYKQYQELKAIVIALPSVCYDCGEPHVELRSLQERINE